MSDESRKLFEEAAFGQYFTSTIKRNPDVPNPRISGCMDFVSIGCKTMAQFVAKNADGDYIEDSLNPAWWAWQEAMKKAIELVKDRMHKGCVTLYDLPSFDGGLDEAHRILRQIVASGESIEPRPTGYFYWCERCEREVEWKEPDGQIYFGAGSEPTHTVCDQKVEIRKRPVIIPGTQGRCY